MNNMKTAKQEIEERLNNVLIEIRLPLDLHKKMTDMIFEAAYRVESANQESEKKEDPILKQMTANIERKLVKLALREIGRRLEMGNVPFIKFNIKLETLFNILNSKG